MFYDYDAVVRGLKEITFVYTTKQEARGLKTLRNIFQPPACQLKSQTENESAEIFLNKQEEEPRPCFFVGRCLESQNIFWHLNYVK